jgi:hypothetical protein
LLNLQSCRKYSSIGSTDRFKCPHRENHSKVRQKCPHLFSSRGVIFVNSGSEEDVIWYPPNRLAHDYHSNICLQVVKSLDVRKVPSNWSFAHVPDHFSARNDIQEPRYSRGRIQHRFEEIEKSQEWQSQKGSPELTLFFFQSLTWIKRLKPPK